ncbi:hypothetical protein HPB51_006587 [Rhipicephalus microplus]|uniref:Retrotransposon gag domain-containing protein n=1 Tax=Rhipicephalus microplus TaxID=6941 RepID=A0A9J6E6D2_RHIMP|nr:hypothetical protein HPB51_006587 [Rhipicephalus microplus]
MHCDRKHWSGPSDHRRVCASVRRCAPPPLYSGVRDLQLPEEFLERLKNFCFVTGVAADKRPTHVVPAALEGGTKLWWRFVRGFDSWEQFTAAFRSEFSSVDVKRRLQVELKQRTQHLEENLKEFIYAIAMF